MKIPVLKTDRNRIGSTNYDTDKNEIPLMNTDRIGETVINTETKMKCQS